MVFLIRESGGKFIADERYGHLYETASPIVSSMKNLAFAVVFVYVGKESPLHYHKKTEEIYYMVDGQGIMTMGDQQFEVHQGDTISIPIMTPHKIKNTGSSLLKLISVDYPPYDPYDDYEIICENSGTKELSCWINAHFFLHGQEEITQDESILKNIQSEVMKQYQNGRLTVMSDNEILELVKLYMTELWQGYRNRVR